MTYCDNRTKDDLFTDFELYSRALIVSKDVDPTYPLIKDIIKEYEFDPEWFVFCYVAFYSIETAIKMCSQMKTREKWDEDMFRNLRETKYLSKFNHERRGSCRNVDNQVKLFDGALRFLDWYESQLHITNGLFRTALEKTPFHGAWASFKIAELFEKSLGDTDLSIPDLGLEGRDPNKNDGPIGGLRWLYGRDNTYYKEHFTEFNRFGFNLAKAWGVDIGEVETCLCKWHKMNTGKYFIGHDIQEFVELEKILGSGRYDRLMEKNFDSIFWEGIDKLDKEAKKKYTTTGKILNWKFSQELPKIDVLDILINS